MQGVDTSSLTGGFKDAADIMNSGDVQIISSKSFPSANEDSFINNISTFFLDDCEDIDGALESLDEEFANFCRPDKAFAPHPAWTKRTLSAI